MLALLAIVALGSLTACGQKGPLVLPDAQRPHKKIGLPKPPTPAPSPASPTKPPSQPSTSASSPANATSPQQ